MIICNIVVVVVVVVGQYVARPFVIMVIQFSA